MCRTDARRFAGSRRIVLAGAPANFLRLIVWSTPSDWKIDNGVDKATLFC